jgi:hypothetical protein
MNTGRGGCLRRPSRFGGPQKGGGPRKAVPSPQKGGTWFGQGSSLQCVISEGLRPVSARRRLGLEVRRSADEGDFLSH